eukprot:snap_masked-scaffold_89-processed-gene-0.19-mRNA-1 protein AED:1.00 eAED:1.00 QI:0/-1/0/0/-1/1/1/0/252
METEKVSLLEALLVGKTYDSSDGTEGYWGKVTGIDWCENNYAISPFIAEFWNTTSNLGFICAGLYTLSLPGLPQKFKVIGVVEVLLGLLSGAFHATLWWSTQKADEVIENWLLALLYHSEEKSPATAIVHCILCTLGILFLTFFLFCEVHLVSLSILAIKRVHDLKHLVPESGRTVRIMNMALAVAAACWVVDRVLCNAVIRNFQLHAWWHLLCALGIHQATMLSIVKSLQKKTVAKLVDRGMISTLDIVEV